MVARTSLLSAERLAQAKEEARDLLEYSIYILCMTYGVDIESIGDSYDIPFALTEYNGTDYNNHVSLQKQVAALTRLNEV